MVLIGSGEAFLAHFRSCYFELHFCPISVSALTVFGGEAIARISKVGGNLAPEQGGYNLGAHLLHTT